MNFDEIFSCKQITQSSLNLYKTKLRILNDNKSIKNINYLYDIEKIQDKIKHLKETTRRSYLISIVSVLACLTKEDKKPPKKLKKLYQDYSKILDGYNSSLQDQTNENVDVISKDEIAKVQERIKDNRDANKQAYQDYVILSLYTLIPPRRNKDYQLMKLIKKFNEDLSKDYNYYDGSKFYFNNYKTRGTYNLQEIEVPANLKVILDFHIKANNIKNDEYILYDYKKQTEIKGTNGMTLILNKIFKKRIGASALRRAYLTNKYGDLQNELKEDVLLMGTSKEMATNNYIKKT